MGFYNADHQEPHARTAKWSNLRDWLESDHQLYWITGKAGSGKSTLMKFLCFPTTDMPSISDAHDVGSCGVPTKTYRCCQYLEKWADRLPLVIVSFYFWNSGKEIQMTRGGLLRDILCQLVSQRPEIIGRIAPKHWETLCIFGHQPENWHVQLLHNIVFQAVEMLHETSKICFFIDGLDEFASNHDDLISMVKNLIHDKSQVKVCVASRPWNILQDALGHGPSLRLEDLTFNDIKVFVQSKFHADPEFEKLKCRYPSFTDQLIENIVVKASGVFSWVDVVVASLLGGMSRGDRIQDFQQRLDELPPDLEKLYEKILYSLDQRYLEHAAQYFTLLERAEVPLTILQFAFADEDSPDSASKMPYGSLNDYEVSLRVEAMSRRLNSRCKGFLETDRGLQSIYGYDPRPSSRVTVQYLHRTLRDFIKSPKVSEYLRSSVDPRFDLSLQLCVAYVMDVKAWPGDQEHLSLLDQDEEARLVAGVVNHCIRAAAGASPMNEIATNSLLEELRNAVKQPAYWRQFYRDLEEGLAPIRVVLPNWNQLKGQSLLTTFVASAHIESFLRLAVRHGATSYVKAKANKSELIPKTVPKDPRGELPLLTVALCCEKPKLEMVECLLDLGADPNMRVSKQNSQTPWTFAISRVSILYTIRAECSRFEEYWVAESRWKQTLKLMFLRGGHQVEVPDALLTSISRKLLGEILDEVGSRDRPTTGFGSWFGSLKLM